jgi:pimeloyl-ACP methyl ester carboxylesterase
MIRRLRASSMSPRLLDTTKGFPAMPWGPELVPQPDGFVKLSAKGMNEDFCQDLSAEERLIMVATQPYTSGSLFEAKVTAAAWRGRPSWYVVASDDRMISPDQERSMAKQIGAATTVLPSSHVAMQSHPREVAEVIAQAAAGAAN